MDFVDSNAKDLVPDEVSRLAELETVIRRGLETFRDVGSALKEIRDGRLYRATHKTFDEYLEARWELTRSTASRMISAAEVAADIDLSPIGDIARPTAESQLRPLVRFNSEERQFLWKESVEAAAGGQPTAAIVAKVVKANTPSRISGGTTFDLAEIENAAARPAKPLSNGSAIVSSKDREIAIENIRKTARSLRKLDVYDEFADVLDAMLRRVKSLGSDAAELN